jgi:hypothetical protein
MLHIQTPLYIFQQHLDRYGNKCDAFLDRIITGDETCKRQGMEWKHPQLHKKKVQKPTICKKTDAYSFWDSQGPVVGHNNEQWSIQ